MTDEKQRERKARERAIQEEQERRLREAQDELRREEGEMDADKDAEPGRVEEEDRGGAR
ncbi:hypothetical protein BH23CHL8_BH23CHL8_18930 [soil metagenome]